MAHKISEKEFEEIIKEHPGTKVKSQKPTAEKMKPVTVRFPQDTADEIKKFAKENGCSMADLVRWSFESDLSNYLHAVRFMDYDQGEEIRIEVEKLITKMSEIELEMKREGNNINQIAKDLNAIMDNKSGNVDAIYVLSVLDNCQKNQQKQINKYASATKKAGDELCRILT